MAQHVECSDDEIVKVAHGCGSSSYERHIRFCKHCAARLRELQDTQAALREGDTWSATVPSSASVATIKDRDAIERTFALTAVPALVDLPEHARYAAVNADQRHFSAAVLWALLDVAYRESERSPFDSVAIYRLCCYIADETVKRRPFGAYERCRYAAWKELGWVYRCIGELDSADVALDTAAAAAAACPAPEQKESLARVNLSRAGLYANMRRYAAALTLARSARTDFEALNLDDCIEMAAEQEAHILLLQKDGAAAVAILQSLVLHAADDATRARRCQNFAHALEISGAHAEAAMYARTAIEIHERLGATYYVHKDRWSLGRILEKLDQPTAAISEFAAAATFMRTADPHSAVLIDLDRGEVELKHDLVDEATYDRIRAVATYAIDKRLPEAACRALLYLQRLGAEVKAFDVRFVRSFIADLEHHPHREFVPPGVAA